MVLVRACSCASADSAVPPRGAPRKLVLLHVLLLDIDMQHGARPAEGRRVHHVNIHTRFRCVSRYPFSRVSDATKMTMKTAGTPFPATTDTDRKYCVKSD